MSLPSFGIITAIKSSRVLMFLTLNDNFTNSMSSSIASFFVSASVIVGCFSSSSPLRRMTTLR